MKTAALAALLALPVPALPFPALAHEGHAHVETSVFAPEALHPADVPVTDQTGRRISFRDDVVGEGPVMMTFVYSNCTTVCPVANTILQVVEDELDRRGDDRMRLVSVSIDPVTDTPEKMAALADELGAGPRWRFVTGAPAQMDAALRSMGARPESVGEHDPMFLIRAAGAEGFVRVLGLPAAEELLAMAQSGE